MRDDMAMAATRFSYCCFPSTFVYRRLAKWGFHRTVITFTGWLGDWVKGKKDCTINGTQLQK